jgi:predicted RNA-binding protein with PIN domain
VVYLIDGYNLMHALGMMGRTNSPRGLAAARTHCLDWLAGHASERPGDRYEVVFDAPGSARAIPTEIYKTVVVRTSYRETADDVIIRELSARAGEPVTVVSNDRAIADAAKRSRRELLTCSAFVDRMLQDVPGEPPNPPAADKKPVPAAADEELLKAFQQPPRRRSARGGR